MSEEDERPGRLRPTSGAALALCVSGGLVLGWALHPITESMTGSVPRVAWAQPLVLLLAAAVLAGLAWTTWRQVHVRRMRFDSRLAVNRLVLARASALAGALVGGAYGGFAISWLGNGSDAAGERIVRSLVAVVGAVVIVVSSLLLERACRTPPDLPPPVT